LFHIDFRAELDFKKDRGKRLAGTWQAKEKYDDIG
jgi:hypothetical protein